MAISMKTLGRLSNPQLFGLLQDIADDGGMPSPSLAAKLKIQLESRGITYEDVPRIKPEQPDPKTMPEPRSTNHQVRVAIRALRENERNAVIPWDISTSPQAHLDGETYLYQEITHRMTEYLAYGELCTGCRDELPFPCLEELAGGVRCVDVPMTRGLALLLLEDDHPQWYRAWMMRNGTKNLNDAAHILHCNERTVRRRVKKAEDYLRKKSFGEPTGDPMQLLGSIR